MEVVIMDNKEIKLRVEVLINDYNKTVDKARSLRNTIIDLQKKCPHDDIETTKIIHLRNGKNIDEICCCKICKKQFVNHYKKEDSNV